MKNANYRKHNDRSHNSSTYHKKDGTATRHLLKQEAKKEIEESNERKKVMKVFVECKKCGFEVVPNEDGTCYNCSEPMEEK